MRQLTQAMALATLGILLSAPHEAGAAEQRCNELGANCKCSQPYTASAITADATNSYGYTPVNDTARPCLHDGVVVTRNHTNSAPTMSNNATILTALPSGHTIPYVLKFPDGYTGISEIGYNFKSGEPANNVRWAYRWYEYYSNDYQATTGTCLNSGKWFTMRPGYHESSYWASTQTTPLMYGWTNWANANLNCCNIGPGYDSSGSPDVPLPGKWWRYEVILRNIDGSPGAIIQAYRKNVTDNAPERRIIDTSIGCIGCGDNGSSWSGLATTALQPYNGQPLSFITTELFRNGTCAGYVALSHQMMAGWNTDSGQRIGAAREVEGNGSGDVTPPSSPTNLNVTLLIK